MGEISRKRNRLVSLVLAVMMAMTVLAGCSSSDDESKPQTATSMAQGYKKALTKVENFAFDGKVNVDAEITSSDSSAEFLRVPANVTFEGKADGKGHLYMDMGLDVTVQNQKTDLSMEMYTEYSSTEATMYVHEKSQDVWLKQTSSINEAELNVFQQADESLDELFKEATFEESGDGYVITQKISDLLKSDSFKKTLDQISETLKGSESSAGVSLDFDLASIVSGIADKLGNASLVYTFNKDNLLTNFKTKDFAYADTVDLSALLGESAGKVGVDLKLDIDANYKDYGNVKEEDCTISEEDKAKAVDAGALGDLDI